MRGLGVVLLLLLLPIAAAQTKTPASLSGTIEPFAGPVSTNLTVTTGEVTFSSDATSARASMTGISISYTLVSAPPWLATVVISPPTDVLDTSGAPTGTTYRGTTQFEVQATRDFDRNASGQGEIVIEARAQESTLTQEARTTLHLVAEPLALPALPSPAVPAPAPAETPLAPVVGLLALTAGAMLWRRTL